jgi:ubiquinone/menaquinone biosynthesis C-methylase UbiE
VDRTEVSPQQEVAMNEPKNSRGQALVVRAKAFDQWVSHFTGVYDLGIQLVPLWGPRLRKALEHIQGPRVLEVSFGTGYLLSLYAARFDTTGLDYNPRMIDAARRRLARLGVPARLLCGDAHALPFADGSFDTVVNTDAFTLYQDPQKAMFEFHRVLKPGGRLVLMEYNYPRDRNWLGMKLMVLPKLLTMPYADFDALLQGAGFDYDDYPVGMAGVLHLYVARKRAA